MFLAGFRGFGAVSGPDGSFSISGGSPAGPGRLGVSGPVQGVDGPAAVGEDHRERGAVEAGPVGRAVARTGQAGLLAADAAPLPLIQIFHCPMAAVQKQQFFRRRGPASREVMRQVVSV